MATGQLALTLVLIATSGIGLCYYLRIVLAMFDRGGEPSTESGTKLGTETDFVCEIGLSPQFCPAASAVTLWTMALLLIAIGVLPEPLLRLISWFMP
jgi:NADH:ubiquinone oxidoreductase subunit 2 (subunit N)